MNAPAWNAERRAIVEAMIVNERHYIGQRPDFELRADALAAALARIDAQSTLIEEARSLLGEALGIRFPNILWRERAAEIHNRLGPVGK